MKIYGRLKLGGFGTDLNYGKWSCTLCNYSSYTKYIPCLFL